MATPLKIRDVNGNIQQFTTAEENYISYLVGLHLSESVLNSAGNITNDSNHTNIGSFSNTFFNQPVGTHPSTSITTGTTTTNLYQRQNSAAETDSDIEVPLMWVDSASQTGFKQMPNSDLNEAVDRYLSTIFTNDYPGVFKLGSSSPGPDYSVHLSSVFTDTRTDGTSTAYNIYRRDSYTAPSAVRPIYVRDNGGFDGIQAMNDRQIKFSFGQRAKTRIGNSKIGTYQLRTSAQGAPTDPGTWVSAGSATDTKQQTSDQVYTRDSTTNFVGNYTQNYTDYYQTNYTKLYSREYQTPYVQLYSNQYSSDYEGIQLENFPQTYTGAYTSTFLTNYQGQGSFSQSVYEVIYDTTSRPHNTSDNLFIIAYVSNTVGYSRSPADTGRYGQVGFNVYTGIGYAERSGEGVYLAGDGYANLFYSGPVGYVSQGYNNYLGIYYTGSVANQGIKYESTGYGLYDAGAKYEGSIFYESPAPVISDGLALRTSTTQKNYVTAYGPNVYEGFPTRYYAGAVGVYFAGYLGLNYTRLAVETAYIPNYDDTRSVTYVAGNLIQFANYDTKNYVSRFQRDGTVFYEANAYTGPTDPNFTTQYVGPLGYIKEYLGLDEQEIFEYLGDSKYEGPNAPVYGVGTFVGTYTLGIPYQSDYVNEYTNSPYNPGGDSQYERSYLTMYTEYYTLGVGTSSFYDVAYLAGNPGYLANYTSYYQKAFSRIYTATVSFTPTYTGVTPGGTYGQAFYAAADMGAGAALADEVAGTTGVPVFGYIANYMPDGILEGVYSSNFVGDRQFARYYVSQVYLGPSGTLTYTGEGGGGDVSYQGLLFYQGSGRGGSTGYYLGPASAGGYYQTAEGPANSTFYLGNTEISLYETAYSGNQASYLKSTNKNNTIFNISYLGLLYYSSAYLNDQDAVYMFPGVYSGISYLGGSYVSPVGTYIGPALSYVPGPAGVPPNSSVEFDTSFYYQNETTANPTSNLGIVWQVLLGYRSYLGGPGTTYIRQQGLTALGYAGSGAANYASVSRYTNLNQYRRIGNYYLHNTAIIDGGGYYIGPLLYDSYYTNNGTAAASQGYVRYFAGTGNSLYFAGYLGGAFYERSYSGPGKYVGRFAAADGAEQYFTPAATNVRGNIETNVVSRVEGYTRIFVTDRYDWRLGGPQPNIYSGPGHPGQYLSTTYENAFISVGAPTGFLGPIYQRDLFYQNDYTKDYTTITAVYYTKPYTGSYDRQLPQYVGNYTSNYTSVEGTGYVSVYVNIQNETGTIYYAGPQTNYANAAGTYNTYVLLGPYAGPGQYEQVVTTVAQYSDFYNSAYTLGYESYNVSDLFKYLGVNYEPTSYLGDPRAIYYNTGYLGTDVAFSNYLTAYTASSGLYARYYAGELSVPLGDETSGLYVTNYITMQVYNPTYTGATAVPTNTARYIGPGAQVIPYTSLTVKQFAANFGGFIRNYTLSIYVGDGYAEFWGTDTSGGATISESYGGGVYVGPVYTQERVYAAPKYVGPTTGFLTTYGAYQKYYSIATYGQNYTGDAPTDPQPYTGDAYVRVVERMDYEGPGSITFFGASQGERFYYQSSYTGNYIGTSTYNDFVVQNETLLLSEEIYISQQYYQIAYTTGAYLRSSFYQAPAYQGGAPVSTYGGLSYEGGRNYTITYNSPQVSYSGYVSMVPYNQEYNTTEQTYDRTYIIAEYVPNVMGYGADERNYTSSAYVGLNYTTFNPDRRTYGGLYQAPTVSYTSRLYLDGALENSPETYGGLLYFTNTNYISGTGVYTGPGTSYTKIGPDGFQQGIYTGLNTTNVQYEGPYYARETLRDNSYYVGNIFTAAEYIGANPIRYLLTTVSYTGYVGPGLQYTVIRFSDPELSYNISYSGPGTAYIKRQLDQYDNSLFATNYTGPAFSEDYINAYQGALYLTAYAQDYTGAYTGLYNIIYTNDYSIDYSGQYTNVYTTDYTADYENSFESQYQQDYLGNFAGDFAGETIQSTSETNETYTLYVRIA